MIIMKYAKYIACLTVALLLTVELFAQTAVSGRITDKNGESVIGATILVKGTTTGTSSDAEGRYKIVIPAAAEKTLQVSYLGYKPQVSPSGHAPGSTSNLKATKPRSKRSWSSVTERCARAT